MSRLDAPRRLTLDVSHLHQDTMDHRSPIWWGNLLLLIIETTMFGCLIAAYFYYRWNFDRWPPVRAEGPQGTYNTDPVLLIPTLNLGLILLSVVPMVIADRACLRMAVGVVKWSMLVLVLMILGAIALRFREFKSLIFRWDENAYSGITWTILGMHLLHLLTGFLEGALMTAWVFRHGLDEKHARDIRVTGVYWYWVAGVWVILYGIVYWAPRVI